MDVLLQNVLPNLYSAIPSTIAVKGQLCYADASCHLLGYMELVLLFSTCRFDKCFFASGTLVSAMEVLLVCPYDFESLFDLVHHVLIWLH